MGHLTRVIPAVRLIRAAGDEVLRNLSNSKRLQNRMLHQDDGSPDPCFDLQALRDPTPDASFKTWRVQVRLTRTACSGSKSGCSPVPECCKTSPAFMQSQAWQGNAWHVESCFATRVLLPRATRYVVPELLVLRLLLRRMMERSQLYTEAATVKLYFGLCRPRRQI